ncbi:MAG: hypothetical protein AABW82_01200 [Nanoarchaeota archaeon]
MNAFKRFGLVSLVAGSAFIGNGCADIDAAAGRALKGEFFPFHQNTQNQQQGNISSGGMTGNSSSYNSGESRINGPFGEVYTISAANYIGNSQIADVKRHNFVNVTGEFEPGQPMVVGFDMNTSAKDVNFKLYDSRGRVLTQYDFNGASRGGFVRFNAPNTSGKFTYSFTGKDYRYNLFGKETVMQEQVIVNSTFNVK